MKVYFTQNVNNSTLKKSSSGGFFSSLADYVIKNNGVIFGAVFDENFNVIIKYTENNFNEMIGSKYVKSSTKNTFSECKHFLDNDKIVLYTGTPCQIIGLKSFLKHDYPNLITMYIICHGSPNPKIWEAYLKSFNKKISNIYFRDKRNGWNKYNFTIKFEDGTEFTEYHQNNKYMKLFLQNKILCEPCYTCKSCKNSKADFTVGDAWNGNFKHPAFKNNNGTSCVICHTNKSLDIFNSISSNMIIEETNPNYLNTSYGYVHNYIIPKDKEKITKSILSPKIAMVTIPGHNNIGNTLQTFALQSKIKEILPNSNPIVVNSIYTNYTDFYKNKIQFTKSKIDSTYDMVLVGSDQIWSDKKYLNDIPFNDRFLNHPCKKVVYAASFGNHILHYNNLDTIKTLLSKVKYISTRELSGKLICKHYFNLNNVHDVLDPTMLYDKEFYLNAINESICTTPNGIFSYILDNTNEWTVKLNSLSKTLNQPILQYDGSVESFIKNINNAKMILTDSYHGTVFSLIFNKPFICLRNTLRGNDRFDDLSVRFNIESRFINSLNHININLLTETPNAANDIIEYRKESIKFLTESLLQF